MAAVTAAAAVLAAVTAAVVVVAATTAMHKINLLDFFQRTTGQKFIIPRNILSISTIRSRI